MGCKMGNTYLEFVKDKRVAIVGCSKTMDGSNLGEIIDSYDLVMRFNTALPLKYSKKNDIGSKTNIMCNCLSRIHGGRISRSLLKIWKDSGVSWVIYPVPIASLKHDMYRDDYLLTNEELSRYHFMYTFFKKINKNNDNKKIVNLKTVSLDWYLNLKKQINSTPSTGLSGIYHTLSFPVKEVFICGFSFGSGGYYSGYKSNMRKSYYDKCYSKSKVHNFDSEKEFVRNLYKKDERIKLDRYLNNLFIEKSFI